MYLFRKIVLEKCLLGSWSTLPFLDPGRIFLRNKTGGGRGGKGNYCIQLFSNEGIGISKVVQNLSSYWGFWRKAGTVKLSGVVVILPIFASKPPSPWPTGHAWVMALHKQMGAILIIFADYCPPRFLNDDFPKAGWNSLFPGFHQTSVLGNMGPFFEHCFVLPFPNPSFTYKP